MSEWKKLTKEQFDFVEERGGIYFECPCEYYKCYLGVAHGNSVQKCKKNNRTISNWAQKIPLWCHRRKEENKIE